MQALIRDDVAHMCRSRPCCFDRRNELGRVLVRPGVSGTGSAAQPRPASPSAPESPSSVGPLLFLTGAARSLLARSCASLSAAAAPPSDCFSRS